MNWAWVPSHLVLAWHRRLVDQFGGTAGLRDLGLLEGALAHPINLVAYEPQVGVERLAALYGVGIAKAHAFIDGNKRIAFAVMVAFLRAHQHSLDVAAGNMDDLTLGQWLTRHCRQG